MNHAPTFGERSATVASAILDTLIGLVCGLCLSALLLGAALSLNLFPS